MDGKHIGTGSRSAAIEVQRGKEKRRKRVNFAEEDRKQEERGSNVMSEEITGQGVKSDLKSDKVKGVNRMIRREVRDDNVAEKDEMAQGDGSQEDRNKGESRDKGY